jgi:hypothetical protein
MKKVISLLFSLAAIFAVTACSDSDDVAKNFELSIGLTLPEGVTASDITSAQVTVVNQQTGVTYSSEEITTAYKFAVPAGVYDVTASLRNNNGTSLTIYSGSKSSVSVYEAQSASIILVASEAGSLVFKEVYYNMVKPNGIMPYMRDQFIEIYNNSDEVLYLDNCIIGILEGSQGMLPTSWMENGEIMKEYALGYYTVAWISKEGSKGTTYPVQPGQSIVVASQAQNHIAETADAYDPTNANAMQSPVDLSKADFEVCLTDYKPAYAIDNPDVPNLNVIYANGTQNYFMIPYSGNAIILAKFPSNIDPVAYAQDEANLKERPDGTYAGTTFLVVPQDYVLDGINIVNNNANYRVIRLRSEVDAGSVHMSAIYAGKSIRRKVEGFTESGRAILKDTNNSTDDFLSDQVPTPGKLPSVAD